MRRTLIRDEGTDEIYKVDLLPCKRKHCPYASHQCVNCPDNVSEEGDDEEDEDSDDE